MNRRSPQRPTPGETSSRWIPTSGRSRCNRRRARANVDPELGGEVRVSERLHVVESTVIADESSSARRNLPSHRVLSPPPTDGRPRSILRPAEEAGQRSSRSEGLTIPAATTDATISSAASSRFVRRARQHRAPSSRNGNLRLSSSIVKNPVPCSDSHMHRRCAAIGVQLVAECVGRRFVSISSAASRTECAAISPSRHASSDAVGPSLVPPAGSGGLDADSSRSN